VKECGAEPVVLPAMGSHGGATAEGQARLLEMLGVTEQQVGARIEATMDTVQLGSAPNGAEAHLDAVAAQLDGIIVLGRVKTHPESASGLASGLLKMVTIGLGKQIGARNAHYHGLWDSVRQVSRIVLDRGHILCGVAVVENAYRRPVKVEVVPPRYEAFLEADQRLLKLAKRHWAKLPFNQLDVLVVDEIGKNISGAGMDPNIVGKWRVTGTGRKEPNYHRIVVLSLTPESLGNAMGAGIADIVTERFAGACDPQTTYINMLTASEPDNTLREPAIPIVLPTDRDAIEVAVASAMPKNGLRFCRIHNTDELHEFRISQALVEEAGSNPKLTVEGDSSPMTFDEAGNLLQ